MKPRRDTRCACGARYGDLRTGLTFGEVARSLKTHDPTCYRTIYRRGVLGAWREFKIHLWNLAHGACNEPIPF